jgi:hypothetical protein
MTARTITARVIVDGVDHTGTATVEVVSSTRFPGDPGVGKVLSGATVYTGSMGQPDGNTWLTQQTGKKHLLSRRYYSNLWTRSQIIADQADGRVPFPSFKLNGTTGNIAGIASGSQDAALTAEAVWAAGQGYPIHCSFFHEPEDNFESDAVAASYRAAVRRVVGIFRANGATNVVWNQAIWMTSWSFLTNGGEAGRGPWYKWDPDWKGTITGSRPGPADWWTDADSRVDLFGFDQYCPTIGGSSYHEFSSDIGAALSRMALDARPPKPWTVPEMGTKTATGLPGDGWTGYFQRAFRFMRDNGGVGFVYYNTDDNNFLNGSAAAARFAGYQAALSSEAAYLVHIRP